MDTMTTNNLELKEDTTPVTPEDLTTEGIDEAVNEPAVEDVLSPDVYVHEFKKPFKWEGNTYERLTFEFGELTGEDDLAIENELTVAGKANYLSATTSGEYQLRFIARACTTKIGIDVYKKMSIADWRKIRSKAKSFLLKSGF